MRRMLLLLAILTGLGVATSYGVAWFGAALSRPAMADNRLTKWISYEYGVCNGWSVTERRGRFITMRSLSPEGSSYWREPETYTPPAFSIAATPLPPGCKPEDSLSPVVACEKESGWPLRCARVTWEPTTKPGPALPGEALSGGFLIEGVNWGVLPSAIIGQPNFEYVMAEDLRAFPVRPMWRGLAGNTALYAGAWALLLAPLFVPGLILRWRRRRRGRCIRCAYDLAGSDADNCSECGWLRTRRAPCIGRFPLIGAAALLVLVTGLVVGFGVHRARAVTDAPTIHRAAATGDIDLLMRELARGVDPDLPMPYEVPLRTFSGSDWSPMAWAAARGQAEACLVLIEAGADSMGASDRYAPSPLEVALEYGHDEVVALLQSHAPPGALGDPGVLWKAMHAGPDQLTTVIDRFEWEQDALDETLGGACYAGKLRCAEMLIDRGAKLDAGAIVSCVQGGSLDALNMLIRRGATVSDSDTALLWQAADNADLPMLRRLIELGADIDHERMPGWTPLRRSVVNASRECFEALIEAGADPRIVDDHGEGLLHLTSFLDDEPEFYQRLIDLGLDVDRKSGSGKTPLMHAVHSGSLDQVRMLLEACADPTIVDADGNTAASYTLGDVDFREQLWVTKTDPNPQALALLREWTSRSDPPNAPAPSDTPQPE